VKAGHDYFYTKCMGFYSWAIGVNLASYIQKYCIPELCKFLDDDKEKAKLKQSFDTNWSGLKKIDNDLYIPMFGFKSTDEYYDESIMTGRFKHIKVPTFCLSADNDQITPPYTNPYKECQAPDSNVILATTEYGAHCCHVTGTIKPRTWF
jgi:predicted alpha/beta-fold hydrolase